MKTIRSVLFIVLIVAFVTNNTSAQIPSIPELESVDDSGISNTDNITNIITNLTFTGTGVSFSTVELWSDVEGFIGTDIVDPGGFWLVDGVSLFEGTHYIWAEIEGIPGPTLQVQIDTQAPFIVSPLLFISGGLEQVHIWLSEEISLLPGQQTFGLQIDDSFTGQNNDRSIGSQNYEGALLIIIESSVSQSRWDFSPPDMSQVFYDWQDGPGNIFDMAGNEMWPIIGGLGIDVIDGFSDYSPPTIINNLVLYPNGTSPETVVFSIDEELNLVEGATITGFTTNIGLISSAIYSGAGTTNTITITSGNNGDWDLTTEFYYTQGTGNIYDLAANELESITINSFSSPALVYETIPPSLTALTLTSNNAGNDNYTRTGEQVILTFTTDDGLNLGSILLSNVTSGGGGITDLSYDYAATGNPNEYTAILDVGGGFEGFFAFDLTFADEAGNMVASTVTAADITGQNVSVDNTAPTVVISSDVANSLVKDADLVRITASFTETNTIEETPVPNLSIGTLVTNALMTKSGGNNKVWYYDWNVPAGNDGYHAVTIVGPDEAANAIGIQAGQTLFLVDNTLPDLSFTSLEDGTQTMFSITFNEQLTTAVTNITDIANLLSQATNDQEGNNNTIDVSSVTSSVTWNLSTPTAPIATITIPSIIFVVGQTLRINFVNSVIEDLAGNTISSATNFDGIISDVTPPALAPDEIAVLSSTTLEITLNEELILNEGDPVTGLSIGGAGSFISAKYTGKGSTNLITITGSGFIAANTTVTYTSGGNIRNLANLEMGGFVNHSTNSVQVTMTAGDIAFTYYNGNNDDFAFVLLIDVFAGDQIKFTDNGWVGSSFTTSEDYITWTADVNLLAGTEIVMDYVGPSYTITPAGSSHVSQGYLDFNENFDGDQILAYQGSNSNPTFITAIMMENEDLGSNEWNITNEPTYSSRSLIPSGLTKGVNTLNPNGAGAYFANAKYNVANGVAGNIAALRFLLFDRTNWTISNSSMTAPIAGVNYIIGPDVISVTPTSASRIKQDYSPLQITFDENVVKDPSVGGNITIDIASGGANVLTYPINSSKISITNNVISIDISGDLGSLVNETIYEVNVDGFLFVNADGNHNAPIVGSSEWLFTYDATPPTVSSFIRADSNPHNAGINNGNVDFTVTFSEPVNGVDVTDFFVSPSSANLIGSPTIANVSASSGTVFTVTVNGFDSNDAASLGTLNLDLNSAGTITDEAGNDNVSSVVSGADETYTVINPEPAESISSLTSPSQSGTTINLDWTNSTVDQIAYQHLIVLKESGSLPIPVDGNSVSADLDLTTGTIGQMAINIGHGISSYTVTGLNSGVSYNFEIYPYTNDGVNVDYKTTSPASFNGTTPISTESIVELDPSSLLTIIPYIDYTTVGNSYSFSELVIKDGGADLNDEDNLTTALNELTVSITNFSNLEILGLYDHTGAIISGTSKTSPEGSVSWTGLNISAADNNSKSFSIRGRFNSTVTDDQAIDIQVTNAVSSGSLFSSADAGGAQSTPGKNIISVVATQLDFHPIPIDSEQEVNLPITPNQPQVFAHDVNGNLDLDFVETVTILTPEATISNTPIAFSNVSPGILDFSGYIYTGTGDGAITVNAFNGLSVTSSSINVNPVSISDILSSSGDGTYYEVETINIEISFTQNVTLVSGTPMLELNSSGFANYVSGSGTSSWLFQYTIAKDEISADLDVTLFNLNGSVIVGPQNNSIDSSIPVGNSLAVNKNIIIALFNHAPLVDVITNPVAIDEDALEQTISITGIADGNSGLQTVTSIVATSDNTLFIPDPVVTYVQGATTGSLAYTPLPNASGTATITLVVADDGGAVNGGIDQVAINFDVVVNPVNDTPTISDATFSVDENSAIGTIVGTMLFGDIDSNTFTFSITSGNTNNVFAIDNLGDITVASIADLNFEVNPTYELVIQIEDDAITPLAASATLTINVNDVNDVPSDIILGVDETTIFI